jgi:hypothetical protein
VESAEAPGDAQHWLRIQGASGARHAWLARHYANAVPYELFDRASKAKPLAHNPAQSSAEQAGTDAHGQQEPLEPDAKKPCDFAEVRERAPECAPSQNGAGGNRTPVPEQSDGRLYACRR